MSDYTELVKALRRCDMKQGCFNANCRYSVGKYFCDMDKVHKDAAAAIEGLQDEVAELKRVNMEIFEDLPKRGKWIDDGTKYGIHWFKCSVCGESQDIPTIMLKPYYKYCPVCGAKMMEVQDG